MSNIAQGSPTKAFFVNMLTRDIELNDAILDLLDNCLDGVVRQQGADNKKSMPEYYKGYYAHITIGKDSFCIKDNCGGIPREVAEKYAFRMGNSSEGITDNLPTVGIYGIGMKRAIFKIGQSAEVITKNNHELYKVIIPLEWAAQEETWDFPIKNVEATDLLAEEGTIVKIADINPSISNIWGTSGKISEFSELLVKTIQQSYSFIIQKGFEIKINTTLVRPLSIQLLMDDKGESLGIKPFLFQKTYDDVNVSLAIGFYTSPPSPEDIDDENTMKRSSADAGWTVVCNDRVVLYNDKSHLTGWGEAGVPHYHTQFIGIRGIVIFESNNPKNLPMTTTKRGVDTSSKIYAAVKDKMRQGLKLFTDYTNRWKGQNELERGFSTATKSISIESLIASQSEIEAGGSVKFHKTSGGIIFKPNLPKPPSDKPYKMIRFSKDSEEILDIVEYYYDDRTHSITASQVGEKCFDEVLKLSHKKGDK